MNKEQIYDLAMAIHAKPERIIENVITEWFEQNPQEQADANAKLIAAAPDLLEALIDFLDQYVRYGSHVPISMKMLNKARAAIAKATQ
jgi:hypothetical protein